MSENLSPITTLSITRAERDAALADLAQERESSKMLCCRIAELESDRSAAISEAVAGVMEERDQAREERDEARDERDAERRSWASAIAERDAARSRAANLEVALAQLLHACWHATVDDGDDRWNGSEEGARLVKAQQRARDVLGVGREGREVVERVLAEAAARLPGAEGEGLSG